MHCLSLKNNRKPKFSYCFQRDQKGSPKSLKSTPFLATCYCICLCDCLFPFPFSILDQLYGIITYILVCYIFRCPWHKEMVTFCYRYCHSYVVFETGKSLLLRISFLQIFGVSVLFLLSRNICSFQMMNFLVDPLASNVLIPVAAEYRERGSRLNLFVQKI